MNIRDEKGAKANIEILSDISLNVNLRLNIEITFY